MGFTVMETFMDSLEVYSEKDKGTKNNNEEKNEYIGR